MMTIRRRMLAAFVIILALFVALTFRIGWIQIVQSDVYATKAAEYQVKDERIKPTRGSILDRNGNELAVSSTMYRIWVRLKPYNEEDETETAVVEKQKAVAAPLIANAVGKDEAEILKLFETDATRVRVASDVTKQQMQRIREGINEQDLQIVEIEENNSRKYPLGTLASTVLGSTNYDGNGQSGVELEYNRYLSGIAGRRIASTDAAGGDLTGGEKALYESQDGLSLVLTIDETIQYNVEKALQDGKEETQADRMMAIVMDPKTGDILALASTDDALFDPNDPGRPVSEEDRAAFGALPAEEQSEYLNDMWHNPLIAEVYDPGSVFKLVTVSSAIEEGAVTPDDTFTCGGAYQVADRLIQCWVYPGGHGTQDVRTAVKNSCNPAMIQIIQRLGYERFYNYLELYNITDRTGVDLPGEAMPLIQDEETAIPVGLSTMSFGQGLSVTPIQMASVVSSIANGGKYMQPRIARGLADADGQIVEEFPTKIKRQVISEETAREVREIMDFVAIENGVKGGDLSGYKIGVKTGTSQKLIDGEYTLEQRLGSMVSIAPIEDPRFVVLVLCDTPRVGFYGIETAGPTLKRITAETLRYLNVKPNYSEDELAQMESGKIDVGDYSGMTYSEAAAQLESVGLVASGQDNAPGEDFTIVDQYPKPGMRANEGGTVFLYKN
jgi:stage V sporulation protein D (sporulation-specific penicillin-binding protein)